MGRGQPKALNGKRNKLKMPMQPQAMVGIFKGNLRMIVLLTVVAGIAVVHFQKYKHRQIGVGLAVELVVFVEVGQFNKR